MSTDLCSAGCPAARHDQWRHQQGWGLPGCQRPIAVSQETGQRLGGGWRTLQRERQGFNQLWLSCKLSSASLCNNDGDSNTDKLKKREKKLKTRKKSYFVSVSKAIFIHRLCLKRSHNCYQNSWNVWIRKRSLQHTLQNTAFLPGICDYSWPQRVSCSAHSLSPSLYLHKLSIRPPCGRPLCWLIKCTIIWVCAIQHSNDPSVGSCCLLRQWMCAVTYFEGFVLNPPVFNSIATL